LLNHKSFDSQHIRVIYPATGTGWEVWNTGFAARLHMLLATALLATVDALHVNQFHIAPAP